MKIFNARIFWFATVAAAPLLSTPAMAQDGSSGADNRGVGEIVVTAQRQAQSVLEVPLSIQALSGDQLASSGIRQVTDLQLTTPGFSPSNVSGYSQMYIRGVGNGIFVGADPSVATFIDDVPRVFGTLVNNFVDVERVEVIKGAPGGLYGRNATGGVVNIITRQPDTDALSGKLRVSYGEKNTFQAAAFLNVPLTENIAWTLSGERRTHDPYFKNIARDPTPYTAAMFPGGSALLGTDAQQTADFFNSAQKPKKGVGDEDFWAVSSKLLVRASDNFKITFAGDYSKKADDNGNQLYNILPAYPQGSLAFFLGFFAGTTPNLPAGFLPTITKKFTVAQRTPGFVNLKDYGGSATAVWELPGVDVTSITAYRKNESDYLSELGGNAIRLLEARVTLEKSTLYQELRAVSTSDSPLHYIVGASYLRAKFAGGLKTNIIPPLVLDSVVGDGRYTAKNLSAYAQLGYDLTENLNLTVSGRYIHEKNTNSFTVPPSNGIPLKEEKFLPSATLTYKLDGGGNVYARWARGFKSGGVNPVAPPDLFPDPYTDGGIFKGEQIDTFEVGLRAPLLDHKVQFTTAFFYNDYKNVHYAGHANPAHPELTVVILNAGSARTYGGEATVTARVADPLTVGASVGYLNAKYKDFSRLPSPVIDGFDLGGETMINSPKWQLSFNANLDQPITDNLRLVGSTVIAHTSKTIWAYSGDLINGLPDAVEPGYWLVNARLGVRTSDDKWELAVYAKNLFNEAYSVAGSSAATNGAQLNWGDPRIVGVEATMSF